MICVSLLIPFIIEHCSIIYNDFISGAYVLHPVVETLFTYLKEYQIVDKMMNVINITTKNILFWVSNILIGIGISFYLSFDNMHLLEKLITFILLYGTLSFSFSKILFTAR